MKNTITVELVEPSGNHETRVHVTGPWGSTDLFIQASVEVDDQSLTPWLAALVPIAMATNCDLHLKGSADTASLEGARGVQARLSRMHQSLKQVAIHATHEEQHTVRAAGTGCFFSGGVDSFYTVLRRKSNITALAYIHGFDIRLDDAPLFDLVHQRLSEAATSLGKPLVLVRTNLKSLSDEHVDWGSQYHGSALAAVALALQPTFHAMLIAGTHQFTDVHRWGSSHLLDPLWSSSMVRIEHEAPEVERIIKVRHLIGDDVAMRHLRVCWQNPGGQYNCGKCPKCVRTMISLEAFGGLSRCETLPDQIDRKLLRHYRWRSANDIFYVEENLSALRSSPFAPPALVKEASRTLRRSKLMVVVESLRTRIRAVVPTFVVHAIRKRRHTLADTDPTRSSSAPTPPTPNASSTSHPVNSY